MAEFNKELWEMAKRANSAEEFLALAKENDVELTQTGTLLVFHSNIRMTVKSQSAVKGSMNGGEDELFYAPT